MPAEDDHPDRIMEAFEILRNNEERLRRAESVAQFGYWEFMLGDDTVRTSEGARRIYGLEPRPCTIREVQKIPLPAYRSQLDQALNALVQNNTPYNVEFKIRRLTDGQIRDIHSIAEYDAGRRIVFGVIHDITERKQAEEDLRAKNREYRFLVEAAQKLITFTEEEQVYRFISLSLTGLYPDSITVVNKILPDEQHAICVAVNGISDEDYFKFSELIGYSPIGAIFPILAGRPSAYFKSRLLQHSLDFPSFAGSTFPPDAAAQFQSRFDIRSIFTVGISSPEKPFGSVHILTTDAGAEINASLIESFLDQCGLSLARISSLADLKESEDRFRQMAENIRQVFWLITPERFVYVSPAYETIWGSSSAGLLEDSRAILETVHPDDVSRVEELLSARVYADVNQTEAEFRILHPQAGVRWISVRSYPVYDERGDIVRRAGIAEDITERKIVEQKMSETQKMADIGMLAAGVAHEINNPLQVITGLGDSLLQYLEDDAPLPEDFLAERLNIINRNAWRIAEIIRSLNLYAHAGYREQRPHDLNALIRDTLVLFKHQLIEWKNIQINLELSEELPLFPCDRNDITQILLNLLTNARDAMPDGGEITIATRYDAGNEEIVLGVGDTGSGMRPEVLRKIFLPFFTTKPVGSGAGLGLPIVQNIVKHYGGQIEVRSEAGRGTFVEMRLPPPPADAGGASEAGALGRYLEEPP